MAGDGADMEFLARQAAMKDGTYGSFGSPLNIPNKLFFGDIPEDWVYNDLTGWQPPPIYNTIGQPFHNPPINVSGGSWECHRCGTVWASWVPCCSCKATVTTTSTSTTVADEVLCRACGKSVPREEAENHAL